MRMVPAQPQVSILTGPMKISCLVYLVEAKQIMSMMLKEARGGAVSQQGVFSPIFQGALVGHMPDTQVLGLDIEVARVLESSKH